MNQSRVELKNVIENVIEIGKVLLLMFSFGSWWLVLYALS